MPLPDDILTKIRQDYSDGEMLSIIEILSDLQSEDAHLFSDRILRCILFVAHGSFKALSEAIDLARIDPRDLIVGAEYEGHFGARHHDFSLPFAA